MEKVFLFYLVLLLSGCGVQYEGDNRLMVSGKVTDRDGNSIPNIEVITNVSNRNGWGSHDDIGIDLTDNQGNFTMLFPKPKGKIEYSIQFHDDKGLYQEKKFMNIFYEDFSNLGYNLGEVKLYKKEDLVSLNLYFSAENSSKEIRTLNLIGETSDDMVWVNPLDNNYYYPQYFYQVIKNQTITVEYSLYDYSNNQTTIHSENIGIGEEDLTYTIIY